MDIRQLVFLGASVLAAPAPGPAMADDMLYVQQAEIEIDPAQLDAYRAAVTEQIETAIRVEPGVLALYAVSEQENPARVKVFEIYRDTDAYRSHLETAHFKKYKATVENMVRSLKLVRTTPIMLGTKPK
ncbi:putative quinol monooxygenase [Bradyrhizobium sp.]|jgi:quinol monooxygenase YgiN|uniref:putative quinol monooxygenase n=1 Tax=Bradyrhizobium sp. TaxID=376 RepID=UPI002DFFC1C7|nr:putative quinol monooxygenase [Bradyrhizobium sp.]